VLGVPEVTADEAATLVAEGALLLDVREQDEWDAGHVEAAVHLPMSRIGLEYQTLPTDRRIVCICHVGARSAAVADALRAAGWDAVNLAGGMVAWERAGLPVVG
jgi:rhodanese-related sulfurtransferase